VPGAQADGSTVPTACEAAQNDYMDYVIKADRGDRPGIGTGDLAVIEQLKVACEAACGSSTDCELNRPDSVTQALRVDADLFTF